MTKRYLLTLKNSDYRSVQSRVSTLSSILGHMEVFYGIEGKALSAAAYYKIMARAYAKHRQIITPSEVGCALSHLRMLEEFLKSQEQIALIFEDDVLIGERSIEMLQKSLEFVRPSDILVACSQRGIEDPVRGLRLAEEIECYEVQKEDWGVVKGTFAYAVGREAAEYVLSVQNDGLWPADKFRILCPDKGRLLLCGAFDHPATRRSNLEDERRLKPEIPPRLLFFRLRAELMKSIASKGNLLRGTIRSKFGGYRVIAK
jgi:glycosyl transferase family 25